MRKPAAIAIASLVLATGAIAQYKTTTTKTSTTTTTSSTPPLAVTHAGEPAHSDDEARRISRAEAIKLVKAKKAVYVDVRDKASYDMRHIPGAIHIPEAEILQKIKGVPKGKLVITYCA